MVDIDEESRKGREEYMCSEKMDSFVERCET